MTISFRAVTEGDLPLLGRWLGNAHVERWWHHEFTPDAVARDFGPVLRGEEPAEDLVGLLDGRAFALVQRARWHDYPEYVAQLAPAHAVHPTAVTLDYLIGEPEDVGRGLGTALLRAAAQDTWRRHPDAEEIVIPVNALNLASWRTLESAGFAFVTLADLPPDNPVDPPASRVYRLARPPGAA